jgi:hypothetical protein
MKAEIDGRQPRRRGMQYASANKKSAQGGFFVGNRFHRLPAGDGVPTDTRKLAGSQGSNCV